MYDFARVADGPLTHHSHHFSFEQNRSTHFIPERRELYGNLSTESIFDVPQYSLRPSPTPIRTLDMSCDAAASTSLLGSDTSRYSQQRQDHSDQNSVYYPSAHISQQHHALTDTGAVPYISPVLRECTESPNRGPAVDLSTPTMHHSKKMLYREDMDELTSAAYQLSEERYIAEKRVEQLLSVVEMAKKNEMLKDRKLHSVQSELLQCEDRLQRAQYENDFIRKCYSTDRRYFHQYALAFLQSIEESERREIASKESDWRSSLALEQVKDMALTREHASYSICTARSYCELPPQQSASGPRSPSALFSRFTDPQDSDRIHSNSSFSTPPRQGMMQSKSSLLSNMAESKKSLEAEVSSLKAQLADAMEGAALHAERTIDLEQQLAAEQRLTFDMQSEIDDMIATEIFSCEAQERVVIERDVSLAYMDIFFALRASESSSRICTPVIATLPPPTSSITHHRDESTLIYSPSCSNTALCSVNSVSSPPLSSRVLETIKHGVESGTASMIEKCTNTLAAQLKDAIMQIKEAQQQHNNQPAVGTDALVQVLSQLKDQLGQQQHSSASPSEAKSSSVPVISDVMISPRAALPMIIESCRFAEPELDSALTDSPAGGPQSRPVSRGSPSARPTFGRVSSSVSNSPTLNHSSSNAFSPVQKQVRFDMASFASQGGQPCSPGNESATEWPGGSVSTSANFVVPGEEKFKPQNISFSTIQSHVWDLIDSDDESIPDLPTMEIKRFQKHTNPFDDDE